MYEKFKFYSIGYAVILSINSLICAKPTEDIPSHSTGVQNGHQPFVGFFVFPHGGITLDPQTRDFSQEPGGLPDSQREAIQLHNAMRSAAAELIKTKPDLVILSTPHGFYLDEHFIIIGSPSMSGNAGWSWENFTASFTIAKPESIRLYVELRGAKDPVELLSLGIGQSPLPLHWAEIIPWWFIQQAATEAGVEPPPVIYVGQPPTKSIPGLLKLGADIVTVSKISPELSSKRIAVVVSGDLAHTHSKDPKAPYGFDKSAAIFDGFIKEWGRMDRNPATEQKNGDLLLKKAEAITDPAGSCGYTGLVMLHGMMRQMVQDGINLKVRFYEYAAPTYFGMIVTSWLPQ